MPTLYLLRHAHAVWTPDEDRPLSDDGRHAARRAADCLLGYPITSIFASPYLRACQTVEPLAARLALPTQVEPDLRERALGAGSTGDFAADVRLYPVQLRFVWPSEMDLMAQLAGMVLRHRWGDWQRAPFTNESGRHVSVYERRHREA